MSNHKNNEKTVEVLYQKMGDRWYAFSMVDGEVFVGSLSEEEIKSFPEYQKQYGLKTFPGSSNQDC